MNHGAPSVTVIVPVFNEVDSVVELHRLLHETLEKDFEIVFVDDGSNDGTKEVLLALERDDSATRVIGFRRNYGKSHTLNAGFQRSCGRCIVTVDGDLQDDPAEIPKLLRKLRSGYDVVGGWRRERRDPAGKVFGSLLFNWLVRRVCRVKFRDVNCGLKVLRCEVIEEIYLGSGYHRFLPLLAHWKGFRVCEVEVNHQPRRHGTSSYDGTRIWRGFMDLAVLVFLERVEGRPGRYFAGLGTLMCAVGSGFCLYLLILRLMTGSIQSKFPMLSLGMVLLVVGVELISLGFFAELLGYHFRSRHPVEPVVWEGEEEAASQGSQGGGISNIEQGISKDE